MKAANASSYHWTVHALCLAAVMTAVVFLMTFVPKIPIPLGYAHLGDAAIFLVVFFVGRHEGLLAGCLGSALADLLGGFPVWIGPTLLIKFLMAETFWQIALRNREEGRAKLFSPRVFVGLVLACLVMAAGYTLFGAMLYDSLALGLSSAPGLLMEGAVNIAAFYPVAAVLYRKAGFLYTREH